MLYCIRYILTITIFCRQNSLEGCFALAEKRAPEVVACSVHCAVLCARIAARRRRTVIGQDRVLRRELAETDA